MLWPSAILIAAAAVLAIIGLRITNGSGSADQRVGGAFFVLAAAAAGALAVLWWIIAVTWLAFKP